MLPQSPLACEIKLITISHYKVQRYDSTIIIVYSEQSSNELENGVKRLTDEVWKEKAIAPSVPQPFSVARIGI